MLQIRELGFLLDYLSTLRSELKVKTLLSLLKGEKKIADFRADITETRDTTIIHILEEFENQKLVIKHQNIYQLTSLGLIEAHIIEEITNTEEVIDKFKAFWLLHKITAIPPKLWIDMSKLKQSELVETQASELGAVHLKFLDLVKESKVLRGTSPIFHPDFILLIGHLLSQGNKIELIVTKPVLEKIAKLVDLEVLKSFGERGLLKIYIKDDLEVALAVTDNSFSLGLFLQTGKYDDSMDLISFSKEAIEWGEQLFEETLKTSNLVNIKNLAEDTFYISDD